MQYSYICGLLQSALNVQVGDDYGSVCTLKC